MRGRGSLNGPALRCRGMRSFSDHRASSSRDWRAYTDGSFLTERSAAFAVVTGLRGLVFRPTRRASRFALVSIMPISDIMSGKLLRFHLMNQTCPTARRLPQVVRPGQNAWTAASLGR